MRMSPRRPSRYSSVLALVILTAITGLAITATTAAAAGVRFGFVDSVASWLGGGATVNVVAEPQPTPDSEAPLVTSDLFFSEYIEGSSNNKAIEIYNGTGATIDLAVGGYVVEVYSNGGTVPSQKILSGTIANGDVYVLAHPSANATILAQTDDTSSTVIGFNGNDAFALRKGGLSGPMVDVIGQIGSNPGTEWGTGLTSTADNTLTRLSTVCIGDTNGTNSFDPSFEWSGFAIDTFSNLGSHAAPCGPSTLTYDGNGNTGGTVPLDGSNPYAQGAWVGVKGPGDLVKSGFQFGGWNTSANGTGSHYNPAQAFAITSNTTLYAKWIVPTCFTSGGLDPTFDSDGKVTTAVLSGNDLAHATVLQPDGRIVAVGYTSNGSNNDFALVRYNVSGALDTTFDIDGKVTTQVLSATDEAYSAAIQSDGKIVAVGLSVIGATTDFAVVRYNTNGSLDTSFDGDGRVTTNLPSNSFDIARSVAIQPDGKLVVAGGSFNGSSYDFAVVRYNATGSLDTSFDGDGRVITGSLTGDGVHSIAVQADGKIVAIGRSYNGSNDDFAVVRYNADGSLDVSFDGDGRVITGLLSSTDHPFSVAIQPDGKLVVAGFARNGTANNLAVVRYNSNGSLDTSFDGDGKALTALASVGRSVAIQPDGKILVAGAGGTGTLDFAVVRYNSDGSMDTSFDGDGKIDTPVLSFDDFAYSVVIQPDGKVVLGGYASNGPDNDFALLRYGGACLLPEIKVDSPFSVTQESGSTVDLGSAVLGQPISREFFVINSGTGVLNVSAVGVSGGNASEFVVNTGGAVPFNLNPGQGRTVNVTFTPPLVTGLGLRSTTLSIANTDADENPYMLTLQGTGVQVQYRSKQNGAWSDFNTWERSTDGGGTWVNATAGQTPTSADGAVTISTSFPVNITAPVTIDEVTVQGSSQLSSNPGVDFIINDGPGTDLVVQGSSFFSPRGLTTNNGQVAISGYLLVKEPATFAGNAFAYSGGTLKYESDSRSTTDIEFPSVSGPSTLDISANGTITLHAARTVPSNFIIGIGVFAAGSNLTLGNECSIVRSDGSMTGTPTFAGVVDLTYYNNSVTVGPEFPTNTTALRDLTIASPIDLILSSDATVNGTLVLNAGILYTNFSTLSIAPGGNVSRTSGYVAGKLRKTFTANGVRTYEVGINGYAPVSVETTAGTYPAEFTVYAPPQGFPLLQSTSQVSRRWEFTQNSGGPVTANLAFTYPASEVGTGSVADYQFYRLNGSAIELFAPAAPPTSTFASINGVSPLTTSTWSLAEPLPAPGPIGVSPGTGSIAGGTNVQVSGGNIFGASSITFDGLPCPITNVTPFHINCTTPAHPAGPVDVVVTTPSGSNGPNNAFIYVVPPITNTFNTPGAGVWTAPAGVTSIQVEVWGGGGGGGGDSTTTGIGGGGGGGGAYARTNTYAVVPGNTYAYVVGAGGTGGNSSGSLAQNGGTTNFELINAVGGVRGITATLGGQGGAGGAAGITGTVRFSGGDGGDGTAPSFGLDYGGGGGGSGGSGSNGNDGEDEVPGAAVTGGGAGGAGRNNNNGANGGTPGGGAGGGEDESSGGNGANGRLTITYAVPPVVPEMQVSGNSTAIADGSTTPTLTDHTDFGTGSGVRTFTITNIGTADLNLNGAPIVSVSGSTDFTVTALPSTPVAGGGFTTFQVTFTPTTGGLKTAEVSIASDDADENPYTFAIQGTSLAPVPTITTSATSLAFPSTGTFEVSAEQSYTVSGTGLTADITVNAPSTDFQVSKTSGSGFGSSVTYPQTGGTVATQNVYVRFTPQSPGAKAGNVANISSGAVTQNVAVSGTGRGFVVNSLLDGDDITGGNGICETGTGNNVCTLRAAVKEAQFLSPTVYPITFIVTGTINLGSTIISSIPIVIRGPGAGAINVSGNSIVRQFYLSGNATISGITFSNGANPGCIPPNQGTAIFSNAANLTLDSVVVRNNASGCSDGTVYKSAGTLTVSNSTISGNSAYTCSGILADIGTTFNLTNSTISGNTAQERGGGVCVANSSSASIRKSTIFGNSVVFQTTGSGGGGIHSYTNSNVTLTDSIVAGNSHTGFNSLPANTRRDIWNEANTNSFTNGGNNILGTIEGANDDGVFWTVGTPSAGNNYVGTIAAPVDARVAPLSADPLPTHALLAGSFAIDKGKLIAGITTDQLGQLRPHDNPFVLPAPSGDESDIGAYESQANLVPPVVSVVGGPLTFPGTQVGNNSAEQTYTVSGTDLFANIVIAAPDANFQVSLTSGGGFGSSVSIPFGSGTVSATTIYARFTPQSAGAKTGSITNASTGAITQNVAVNGSGLSGETDVTVSGNNLTITDANGGGTNDTLTISCASSNIIITDPNNTVSANGPPVVQVNANSVSIPLSAVTSSITVNTLGGTDTLTVNLSGCDFIPVGGLFFNGGEIAPDDDALNIVGGNQGNVTYGYGSTNGDGTVAMTNFGTITYTGLEPISNSGTAADVIFNFPGPAVNSITLADDGTSGNGLSQVSGPSFETTVFSNPTNSLTLNSGPNNDSLNVNDLPDLTSSLTIGTNVARFNQVFFLGDITLASGANLTAFVFNPLAVGTSSNISTTGSGAISLTTGRTMSMAAGSSITTVDGAITLNANQQGVPSTGNFSGLDTAGLIDATGNGIVTINATGGNVGNPYGVHVRTGGIIRGGTTAGVTTTDITARGGAAGANIHGLRMDGTANVTSRGGNVRVRGFGGGGGSSTHGVLLFQGPQINSGGNGNVTVEGTGGTVGGVNYGVYVNDILQVGPSTPSAISASGTGSVSVLGTGGAGVSEGVYVFRGGRIASTSGPVTVEGIPGFGAVGIMLDGGGTGTSAITSGANQPITLISDLMELAQISTTINAGSGTVNIRQRTNGRTIELGGADSSTQLGLLDLELDRVTAGTVNIGNANTGNVNVLAPITQTKTTNITTPVSTLVFATGDLGIFGTVSSTLTVNGSGTVRPGASPGVINSGNFLMSAGSNLALEFGGATPGNGAGFHDQVNVTGIVDITDANLSVAQFGGFVPTAGQQYVIINNDSNDLIGGTFAGLAEGAVITPFLVPGMQATISYAGGTNNNDVVLTAAAIPSGTLQFSSANYTVSEGGASATITVTRTGGTFGLVGATYTLNNGTATGGAACGVGIDFVNTGGTVSFADGSATSQTFSIPLCPDAALEPDETINLTLSNPTGGATLGSPTASVLLVQNDDCLVAPSTVYVDDNWVGTVPGTDPDGGASPASNFGCDAFATIQGGVTGVAPGGTVNVASGTYAESQILITKAVSVVGAGLATTTINGGTAANASAGTVRIDLPAGVTGNVSFSGFTTINPGLTGSNRYHVFAKQLEPSATITVANNRMQGTVGGTPPDYGFYAYQPRGPIVFNNNELVNNTSNPVLLENPIGAAATTNVHTNTFTGNSSTAIFAMAYGASDVTGLQRVADNVFNGAGSGVSFNSAFGGGAETAGYTNLQITGNTISALGGAALPFPRVGISLNNNAVAGNQAAAAIENPVVTGNRIIGTNATTSYGVRLRGIVTNPTITQNDIRNLTAGIVGEVLNTGFATGAQIHLNNLVNHTSGIQWDSAVAGNAENNWWGCNAGPGNAGCSPVAGAGAASVDFDPWIVLGVSASPNPITPGSTSTVTANMTQNSAGGTPAGTIPSIPVAFTATQGNIAPPSGTIAAGLATSMFTSTSATSGTGCATVDNQLVCTNVNVTAPNFTFNDVTLAEGNAGTTSFTFTVTRNGGTALASSVTYATANGTAVEPGDYNSSSGVLNFAPSAGNATQTLTVVVNGDTLFELNEQFFVNLTSPVNATISDAQGVGTINNDDPCVVNPVVQNNADDGAGSLRRAVFEACTGATITFNMGSVVSPISLSSGEITVDKNLTIQGPGAGTLTVQNTAAASPTSRIFAVPVGVTATVSGLTLTGGNTSVANGGAINNSGTLTLTNMVITGNNAGSTTSFGGGGIANQGTINLNSTTVSNNTSMGGGGGLMMVNGGTTNITSSTFSGNTGNSAGAILAQSFPVGSGGLPGTLTVTNSTISGNTASAATPCGGIWVNGTLSTANITSSTITNNTGTFGGGLCSAGGPITVRSTIIAGNVNNAVVPDVDTTFTSQGFNLIGNVGTATGFNQPTDQTGTGASPLNPQIVALANNGGPTQTHALCIVAGVPAGCAAVSPAIDKGINAVAPLTFDQRGTGFPRTTNNPTITPATGGDDTDIGAYEVQNTPPVYTAPANQNANEGASTAVNLGSFADASFGPWTVVVNWGDASTNTTITRMVDGAIGTSNHTYADGPAVYTVSVTVTDSGALSHSGTFTVTVANIAPTATFSNGGPYVVGQPGTVTFSGQADPSTADLASLRYSYDLNNDGTFDTGNGTYAGSVTATSAAFPAQAAPGSYTVRGRIIDKDGGLTDYTTIVVVNAASTTTALTSSANPSLLGQPVTFTATISVVSPGAGAPTGTVTFRDNGVNIATCAAQPVAVNVATCTISTLTIGTHPITAVYNGSASFNGSTSNTVNQVVDKANTTTTVTAAPVSPSVFGQSVTFTATVAVVAPAVGTPTGTVSFNIDGNIYCANTPINGSLQATCTQAGLPALPAGLRDVVAIYSGDASFNGSTGDLNYTVNMANTTTVITADIPDPSLVNQPYTVSWTVAANPVQVNSGTPTGMVTVNGGTGGGTCSAPVSAGGCQVTPTTPGAKTVTATYSGDANFNVSTSNSVAHNVNVQITGTIRQAPAMTPIAGVVVTTSGACGSNTATTNSGGTFTLVFNGGFGSACTVTPQSGLFDPISRTYTVNDNINGADFIRYTSTSDIPRTLTLVSQFAVPGTSGTMPVILDSQNNEARLSFTVQYPTNAISGIPTFVCGPQAPGCTITQDTSVAGRVGVTIVPAGGIFSRADGTEPDAPMAQKQVATMNFSFGMSGLPNAAITFVNSPVDLVTSDAANNPLLTRYIDGLIVAAQGTEGDLAGRNSGNGSFEAADVVQIRRFVAGLDTPVLTHNEFQRADTAPATSRGDGILTATDVVQTRRYVAALDPAQAAGGPGAPNAGPIAPPELERSNAETTLVSAGKVMASAGSRVSVPIEMRTNGSEIAVSFVIRYDATKLGNAVVELADPSSGAILTSNADEPGVVRVLVDSPTAFAAAAKGRALVNVSFGIANKAAMGDSRIVIEQIAVSDANARSLPVQTNEGGISIAGDAAPVAEISGRVVTQDGAGLRNATVSLIDSKGLVRTTTTASLGYYRFGDIVQGEVYTLKVESRRFQFDAQMVTPNGKASSIDIRAKE